MAYPDFIKHVNHLFTLEGGYTNDYLDRGGETKYGISKKAFPEVDIKRLTIEKAQDLYYKHYWVAGRCGDLPKYLQYIHFDSCVNHGVETANRLLQKGIGDQYVKIDGVFGQKTFENSHRCSLADYVAQRSLLYAKIVKNDPSQIKFIVGWNNRLVNVAKK
jgi:lysozyme family protein